MAKSSWRRNDFIYIPKKKIEEGVTEIVASSNVLTYQRVVPVSSSSTLAFIDCNPRVFSPTWILRNKQVFVSRPGSSYQVVMLRLHTFSTGQGVFVTAANNVKFVCSHNLSSWACAYVWYIKSQDSNVYHIKDSTKANPYQVGIDLVTNSNYQSYVGNTTPIANIESAQAFRDIQSSGSLIFADSNLSSPEIIGYANGMGYGTKTAVVDLDIA